MTVACLAPGSAGLFGTPADGLPAFGAIALPNGTTRFRLWAPSAPATLALEIDGMPAIPLSRDADGYAQAHVHCGPGTRYRYRIDASLAVPDPASRLQEGDVHGASIVTRPGDYAWACPDWAGLPWEQAVIYEVHAGLAGGFQGVAERLPELAALGITVLELMPIADFPGERNWGYDGVLPYAPDTAYGTPLQLKQLIDSAHRLGMGVMLDVVYNHFGPEGNYLPRYAREFFRDDIATPWGAAIDFRRTPVRRFFQENALYWLTEYRFDGLRLDAVHAIADADWLRELAGFLRARIPAPRRIHLVLENDDNSASLLQQGYDAQWNDDGHHVLHHLLTGESQGYYADYTEAPAGLLARCLAEGFIYQGQPSAYRCQPRGEPSTQLPATAFVLCLQNHDQTGNRAQGERLTGLAQPQALRAAIALQLLAPQIPLLFMGEECGACAPFLYFTSHPPALAEAVREGRRREFARFPDDADAAARARIPDPNDPATYSRSDPWADAPEADDWKSFYRGLLAVRRRLIAPRLAGVRAEMANALGARAVAAHWRMNDGARLSLYANLGTQAVAVAALPNLQTSRTILLFENQPGARDRLARGILDGVCTVCVLEDPP